MLYLDIKIVTLVIY